MERLTLPLYPCVLLCAVVVWCAVCVCAALHTNAQVFPLLLPPLIPQVCDIDGSVLGDHLIGCTVYYNRITSETRFSKPRGWVRLQAEALSRDISDNRRSKAARRSIRPLPVPSASVRKLHTSRDTSISVASDDGQ